ncbi:MAG: PDZ domain-containing protein [Bacteroidetes bacterium]|nr:PDZ domain-containing protein [Bacteroidota bacterium]
MKQYFLKASGIAVIALATYLSSSAQEAPAPLPPPPDNMSTTQPQADEEIIIKKKNDKDTKLTVEIKDGQVFVNGKPMSEFKDDNVIVLKRNSFGPDDQDFSFARPNFRSSPFRDQAMDMRGDFRPDRSFVDGGNSAFLGVASENVDDKGAKIRDVTKNSAAKKAGLKKDDIITKINDNKIDNPKDLTETIHGYKPGEKITVTYSRDGKEKTTVATLGKNPFQSRNMTYSFPNQEMQMRLKELSEMDRLQGGPRSFNFNWNEDRPRLGIKAQDTENDKGAKVLDVDDDSPAAKAGIKEDDIITQFDGKPVNSAMMLAKLARENMDKGSHKISLIRDGKTQELEIKTPKKLNTAEL